jgi:hypothetical protein
MSPPGAAPFAAALTQGRGPGSGRQATLPPGYGGRAARQDMESDDDHARAFPRTPTSGRDAGPPTRFRAEVRSFLELFVLTGFVVAQPLFDVAGRSPDSSCSAVPARATSCCWWCWWCSVRPCSCGPPRRWSAWRSRAFAGRRTWPSSPGCSCSSAWRSSRSSHRCAVSRCCCSRWPAGWPPAWSTRAARWRGCGCGTPPRPRWCSSCCSSQSPRSAGWCSPALTPGEPACWCRRRRGRRW